MFAAFLPTEVNFLREPTSIALAQSIKREYVTTPLSKQAIATSYVQQGNGKPILLLHGFDSSVLEFRSLIPLLAEYNQTWAIDLLGNGFTERLAGISYNPDTIKTHLYYFWKTLINQPMTLVGASMGGATAIDFTLTYPQVVKQLILINSLGYSDFTIGKFLLPPFDYLAVEYWRQRKIQALFFSENFSNLETTTIEAMRCATLHLKMPNWDEGILSFMKSGGYSDLADKINQINTPTLILWSEFDDVLGVGDAEKFQNAITNSKLIWLKDCGHVPQLEQPEIIAKHILNLP